MVIGGRFKELGERSMSVATLRLLVTDIPKKATHIDLVDESSDDEDYTADEDDRYVNIAENYPANVLEGEGEEDANVVDDMHGEEYDAGDVCQSMHIDNDVINVKRDDADEAIHVENAELCEDDADDCYSECSFPLWESVLVLKNAV